jgi:prophage regulatory protein
LNGRPVLQFHGRKTLAFGKDLLIDLREARSVFRHGVSFSIDVDHWHLGMSRIAARPRAWKRLTSALPTSPQQVVPNSFDSHHDAMRTDTLQEPTVHARTGHDAENLASSSPARRMRLPLPGTSGYENLPQFVNGTPLPFRRTIRRQELRLIVPLAETTIYEMEQRGEFPRRFKLTARCVVWDLEEVKVWIESRKQASRSGGSSPAEGSDVKQRRSARFDSPLPDDSKSGDQQSRSRTVVDGSRRASFAKLTSSAALAISITSRSTA